jgi:hypothetical protein
MKYPRRPLGCIKESTTGMARLNGLPADELVHGRFLDELLGTGELVLSEKTKYIAGKTGSED